jgi:K+-transporting ATPase ATPase A chain
VSAAVAAQGLLYLAVLLGLGAVLGRYLAAVYTGRVRFLAPVERAFLRSIAADGSPQDWRRYARSLLLFSLASAAVLFGILVLQGSLPLNPEGFDGVPFVLALHTTVSFVTSTNWQFYAGESTMSDLSQMAGLVVQNFAAPAVGLGVLAAVIRAFRHRSGSDLGNFWVDLVRGIAYVLVPLTTVSALVLVSQGAPQTLSGYAQGSTLEGAIQTIARGPVATQVAIRHLGTNGGGFFNSNGATPFENPTGFTNAFVLLLQLLLPVACVFMFGRMLGLRRQALVILGAMLALAIPGAALAAGAEQHGSQVLRDSGVALDGSGGGNLSDKETRFGAAASGAFAAITTSSSGSGIDAGHDALTAVGGGVALVNMWMGIVGGVGTGLTAMLLEILLAVFVAGLLIGRTPEFLGVNVEAREVKLLFVGLLLVPSLTLALTAITVVTDHGLASIVNPGAHGFTEALYAYASQSANNGSAFAGFGFNALAASLGIVAMAAGRFVPVVAVLAIAGSLAAKRRSVASPGTLRTDTPTFGVLLVGVSVITSGLTILPALALGPIAEALSRGP